MSQIGLSSFGEIKQKMRGNIAGRVALDICDAIARLDFLLHISAWILRFGSIVMELVLLFASPVIMVSVSMPGFDANHPSDIYKLALQALITAADVLVPGGLFSVIEKFVHKQYIWGVPLAVFWLALTILTFLALATPMGVMHMTDDQLKQLLYWRTIDSLVYSALSLVAIVYTVRTHEPALKPEQEDVIATLSGTVADLANQVSGLAKPEIDYTQIVSTILPENIVTSEKIQMVEERILSQLNDQNEQVISLVNSLLNSGEIPSLNRDEIHEEYRHEIAMDNRDKLGVKLTNELEEVIQEEIAPLISEEIAPLNTPVIAPIIAAPIAEKKAPQLTVEKPLPWDAVIAKFPSVIEWQSSGLKSVTRDQIIEATNLTKQKIGRAKLAQVRGGNYRMESVLNWLVNEEPKKEDIKGESNTPQLDEELTPEITVEIADEIEPLNTDELEEVITPQKTRNTVPLFLSDLPHELREDNVVSEEEFERRKAHALKVEKDWESGAYDAPLSDVVDEGIEFAKRYLKGRRTTVNTDPEIIAIGE
jgi:hypothetical protein